MADTANRQLTARLRLEPAGPANARDLWIVHNDDRWPAGTTAGSRVWRRPSSGRSSMGDAWRIHEVHKWIAYDRGSGEVVGRRGLSRTPVDDDWGQIYALLPPEPWVRVAHEIDRPLAVHAHWVEIGWALRREFWGRGYASEIGRAGLEFAFDVLGMRAVVSCTVRHNARWRAWREQGDAPFAVCVVLRQESGGALRTPSSDEAPGAAN